MIKERAMIEIFSKYKTYTYLHGNGCMGLSIFSGWVHFNIKGGTESDD